LSNNSVLGKIYRYIIKKVKDAEAVGDTPIITQKSFRFDLENKLFYQMGPYGYEKLYILFKLYRVILGYVYDKIVY
jgi:hypothetical protein